jgi:hypothetical protein
MKGQGMKSFCKKCTKPYCHEEVVCPGCNGQGLFSAMPLIDESGDYGLSYGLSLAEESTCGGCDGRGTITAYCAHYIDRPVPAYAVS